MSISYSNFMGEPGFDEFDSVPFNSVSFNSVSFNSVSFNSVSLNSVSANSVSFNSVTANSVFANAFETYQHQGCASGDWSLVDANSSTSQYNGDCATSATECTSSSDLSDDERISVEGEGDAVEVTACLSGRWEQPDVVGWHTTNWMPSVEAWMQNTVVSFIPAVVKPVETLQIDKKAPVAIEATPMTSQHAPTWEIKPRLRRRKFGEGSKHSLGGRPIHVLEEGRLTPVALTPEVLRTCFGMPLHEAARTLGICATAVKKCCRKMGIMHWPFQRLKPIQSRIAKLQSSATTPETAREIRELETQQQALLQGHNLVCLSSSQ